MKFAYPLLLSACCFTSLQAETFYLKDGSILVGEAVEIDSKTLEIVSFNNGVRKRKKVAKVDIRKTTREDIEKNLFAEIELLKVTPDLMEVEWYDEQLNGLIGDFEKEFKGSKLSYDVKKIKNILLAEKKVIESGGLKLDGKMIEVEDRAARAYDIDSLIAAKKFTVFLEKNKFNQAIMIAEKMELDFSISKAYGEVVAALPDLVKKYRRMLKFQKEYQVEDAKKDTRAREKFKGNRLNSYNDARNAEITPILKRIEAEKQNGEIWLTVNPFDATSIDEAMLRVEKYSEGVAKKVDGYVDLDAGAGYTQAWRKVEEKDFTAAKPIIEKLESLGMNRAYLGNLEEFYYEEQDKHEEEKRRELRGGEIDILDEYINIDERIQETLYEAIEHIESVNNEESAKLSRASLKVLQARLRRLLSNRELLEDMESQDMDSQNAELGLALKPLITKVDEAYAKQEKSGKFLLILANAFDPFRALVPNPEDFISEKAAQIIAEAAAQQKAIRVQQILDGVTCYVENSEFVTKEMVKRPSHFILFFVSSEDEETRDLIEHVQEYYSEVISSNEMVELVMINKDEDSKIALVQGIKQEYTWPIVLREKFLETALMKVDSDLVPSLKLIDKSGVELTTGLENINSIIQELAASAAAAEPAKKK